MTAHMRTKETTIVNMADGGVPPSFENLLHAPQMSLTSVDPCFSSPFSTRGQVEPKVEICGPQSSDSRHVKFGNLCLQSDYQEADRKHDTSVFTLTLKTIFPTCSRSACKRQRVATSCLKKNAEPIAVEYPLVRNDGRHSM